LKRNRRVNIIGTVKKQICRNTLLVFQVFENNRRVRQTYRIGKSHAFDPQRFR